MNINDFQIGSGGTASFVKLSYSDAKMILDLIHHATISDLSLSKKDWNQLDGIERQLIEFRKQFDIIKNGAKE